MKYLILLFLMSFNVNAIDLGTIDPTDPDKGLLTLSCTKPLQYTDNTDIAIGEQVFLQWKVGVNGGPVDNNVGIVKTSCSEVIDLKQVVDGDYFYQVTAIVNSKESTPSLDNKVTITVKRIPTPKDPTEVNGLLSRVGSYLFGIA